MSILSGLGGLFGIGPDHGDYYQNAALNNKGTQSLAEMLDAARSGQVSDAGKGLMNGGSLQDALKGLSGDQSAGLASSPIYGQAVAQQQVMNDPLLSGLFNKGGSRDQALQQEHDLSTQGFQLQPQDVEAYGQASGNIARMFGQGDQSLSSALAQRGLAAGGSGAGQAQFTGMQGNKNEQLAQSQMQIANDRMNNTMQRLQQTRQFETSLGQLGQNAEQNKFANNLSADQARTTQAQDLSNASRDDYQQSEAARQASMTSQQGALKHNLGDAMASGVYQGVQGGLAGLGGSGGLYLANKLGLPQKPKTDSSAGVPGGSSTSYA